jgi:hypothetical protein
MPSYRAIASNVWPHVALAEDQVAQRPHGDGRSIKYNERTAAHRVCMSMN